MTEVVKYEVYYNQSFPRSAKSKVFNPSDEFIKTGGGFQDILNVSLTDIQQIYLLPEVIHAIANRRSKNRRSLCPGDVIKIIYSLTEYRFYRVQERGFKVIENIQELKIYQERSLAT